jgi:hypothetical protein
MFGGTWGAFESSGHHFFNAQHTLYRQIRAVATVRTDEPTLRYGRQYFREISGNGLHFGHPLSGQCTLAWSRILDTDEMLIALNLDAQPRADWITVDRNLSPPGSVFHDALDPQRTCVVEDRNGRSAVRTTLAPHQAMILKADV